MQTFNDWWKEENPNPWQNAEFEAWASAAWEASERRFATTRVLLDERLENVITPEQFRMARAVLGLTTRELGRELGVSAMAVSRFENGDEKVISVATAKKAETWFRERRVFFGPKHGVCLDQDVFAQERWFSTACLKLLQEAGIIPSSGELIEAHKRTIDET